MTETNRAQSPVLPHNASGSLLKLAGKLREAEYRVLGKRSFPAPPSDTKHVVIRSSFGDNSFSFATHVPDGYDDPPKAKITVKSVMSTSKFFRRFIKAYFKTSPTNDKMCNGGSEAEMDRTFLWRLLSVSRVSESEVDKFIEMEKALSYKIGNTDLLSDKEIETMLEVAVDQSVRNATNIQNATVAKPLQVTSFKNMNNVPRSGKRRIRWTARGLHGNAKCGLSNKLIKRFKCEHCLYQTDNRSHLRRHQSSIHDISKPYYCYICDREFPRSDQIRTHFFTTHPDHRYDPSITKPETALEASSVKDESSQGKAEPKAESVVVKNQVKNQVLETVENPNPAKHLNEKVEVNAADSFENGQDNGGDEPDELMTADIKSITESSGGQKRFQCMHCDFSSRDIWHLKRHIGDVHYRMKFYHCQVCRYATSRKHRFFCHMQIHGELFCFLCDYSTVDVSSFHQHLTACESLGKSVVLVCRVCQNSYWNRQRLKSHMLSAHTQTLLCCDFCQYFTTDESEFGKHVDLHKKEKSTDCDSA